MALTVPRLLREPFFHFLLMGAGLFLLFDQVADPAPPPPEQIVVESATINQLQARHERTWGRSPNEQELTGLIDRYVRDEILYREALSLGLDRGDPVVRQRMRQKVEFLADSAVDLSAPDDPTLQAYLAANSEAYTLPPEVTLRQVLISVDQRGASALPDALALLDALNTDPDLSASEAIGDATLLPATLMGATPDDLRRAFGSGFVAELDLDREAVWQGPVETGFGLHLVRVEATRPGRLPSFEEVRGRLERDWRSARRDEIQAEFYTQLRGGYEVEVRMPSGDAASSAP